MRIHIVCREAATNNRIIPRLGRGLSESTGWPVGGAPDPTATLNYFLPYLELFSLPPDYDLASTQTAAWFTHHDTLQPNKGDLWGQAAAMVDLRLTSARRYLPDLEAYGPAGLVTPPLDLAKFQPDPHYIPADIPVVGVSGWVYPGARKGEDLITRLAASSLGQRIHLIAAGQGWPAPTKQIPWEQLETFYQRLDIYLCPSRVEGVPYPPLESLACGKQIVIPRDVGLLDDLPDTPGIHRYEAGNFNAMCQALEAAIASPPSGGPGGPDPAPPEALRESVLGYTPQAWAVDHQIAFERLLFPPRIPEKLPDWRKNTCSGVYYVAFGGPSREMAKKAIASFKAHMRVPVALVSDQPLGVGEDIFIEQPDRDIGGRLAKINIDRLAPADWRYILYLDADTEVVADIGFLFRALQDGWEFVICKNPGKYHVLSMMGRPDNQEETQATFEALGSNQLLQLNGGVFAYRRNERTRKFFDCWLEEWDRWGARDQAALHRALWRQPLATYVLGNEFNTITRYDSPDITAGILHFPTTARRWSGRIEGRLDSAAAWQAVKE